ncbi:protein SUPPRESSOR OF npr1-1, CONSTITUTIVE 1 isoform X2 [Cannabis sativa]|uniref:protein SUPPRESSOR OF npr1-1, CONSTITUTIVE 1 isoform X2 n=1 Tax=Cannabis sativa TaxID=3483 RepID=UPI0029CA0301|nr:protein SUPPRESSOR OF npr1-1, CONSTITUTIVE 1 isoform X2 [Cannabis sativa]
MGAPISQLFQRFPGCKHLRELPNSICELESLEYLNLGGCVSFDKFPRLPKSIKGLDLSGTLIQKVEYSLFDCLPSVNVLYMQACKKLESLPATICKLKSLQVLNLEDCSQLKSFPEILEPMEKLKYLYLNRSGIEVLPSSIENLVMLETLSLSGCENLKSIPITICKLKFLRELYLGGCSQLKSFPEISEPMEKLEKLYLYGTGIEVLPSSIENLVMLNNLNLSECKNLKSIPTSMINMRNIDSIELDEYPQLQILPYNGLPVEDSSETSTSQLLLTHDQPYICSSCTYSTAILNLHYHGVDFTCCQCFLFYTIRNILAAQYFMDEIFIGKCRDGRVNDWIEAITLSSLHSGDSIDQSIESIFPDLNLPATFLEDYDKCRDEKEKDLIEAITQWFAHQSMGSSLQLNLPFSSPKDLRKYFLGFALCIVVEFEATTLKRDDVLTCKYNLKTKTGQNFQFYSIMQCQKATHFDDDDDDSNLDSSSNHQVFVGYLYRKDISMKRYAFYEEYYDFLLGEEESGIFEFHISKGTIKQCGVHLLYRQNIQLQDN